MSTSSSSTKSQNTHKLVPRKKFDVRSIIHQALKSKEASGPWKVIPDRRMINRIVKDVNEHNLYVKGTPFFDFNFRVNEFVPYLRCLPSPQEHFKARGRRLWQTPVFLFDKIFDTNKKFNGQIRGYKMNVKELMANYEIQERMHKTREHHHPNSPGWNSLTIEEDYENTIEAIFDIMNSCMRTNSISKSWSILLDTVESPLFHGLPSGAIYAGLMHFLIRGVANWSEFKMSSNWRRGRTQDQIVDDHFAFVRGMPPPSLIAGYRHETYLHSNAISLELKRLRFRRENPHDHTKFEDPSTYFYTWKWGVWEQLSEVHQHRIRSGCKKIILTGIFENVGKDLGKGFSEEFTEKLEKSSDGISEKIAERISESSEEMGVKARETFSDFLKEARAFTQDSAETFAQKAREVIGDLPKSMASISGLITSSSEFLQSSFKSISEVFKPYLPDDFSLSEMSASQVVELIGLYVLLVNVEDKFLKGIIFMLILHNLGLLGHIKDWITKIASYIFGGKDSVIEETMFGESWISTLFSSGRAFTSLLYGVFASVFSGRLLSKIEFKNLLRNASNLGRDISFLNRGVDGIIGLFTKIKNAITFVYTWVQEKIFNRKPKSKILAKRIVKWCLSVRYFASEAGMVAMRVSAKARKYAETLYGEGEALLIEAGTCTEDSVPKLVLDIKRHFKDARTIANFLTRLKSMSTFVPTMFHIQFTGQAGVGKSTLTKEFIHKLLEMKFGPEYKNSFWSFNPNIEHYDGYSGQKIMIADDMFRINEPKHLTTLIGLITNTPIMLPMANLEDKGIQMTSEILISSTNTPYPIGKDVFCMEAVYRRRHLMIETIIDPRVRDKATGEFSETLFKEHYPGQNSYDFPHLKFNLLKPVPSTLDTVEIFEDTEEYAIKIRNIINNLEKYNATVLKPHANPVCEEIHYNKGEPLPAGIKLPCKDWTFSELMNQTLARLTAFRQREGVASADEKFNRIGEYFAEIDRIGCQSNDVGFATAEEEMRTLPKVPLISKLMAEMGSMIDTTELDTLIEKGVNVVPELDDMDFEEEFEKIVDEQSFDGPGIDTVDSEEDKSEKPTIMDPEVEPTSLEGKEGSSDMSDDQVEEYYQARVNYEKSLMSEAERRRRILNLKNRTVREKTPLDNAMKWTPGKGIDISYVPTEWHCTSNYRTLNVLNEEVAHMAWFADEIWNKSSRYPDPLERKKHPNYEVTEEMSTMRRGKELLSIMAEVNREINSVRAVFPKTEAFPEHLRGVKSSLSLYFLQHIDFHDGKPYFNPPFRSSSFHIYRNDIALKDCVHVEAEHKGVRKVYKLPVDDSTIWIAYPSLYNFIAEFDTLSPQQQRDLVENAKWRNRYTGFYTVKALKEFSNNIFTKKILSAMEFITSPIYSIYNFLPHIWNVLFRSMMIYGVIYLIKRIAKLFFPGISETSKYLHRGPKSNIQRRIFTTSLLEESKNSHDQFMSAAFRRNIRMIEIYAKDKEGSVRVSRGQCLVSGQYIILNRHVANKIKGEVEFTFKTPGQKEDFFYRIDESNVYHDNTGDISIIYSKNIQMASPIDTKLMTEDEYSRFEYKNNLIFLATDEKSNLISSYDGMKKHDTLSFVSGSDGETYTLNNYFTVKGQGIKGLSGSTVFCPQTISGSHKILGIQAWSVVDNFVFHTIAVQVLTKEKLDFLKKQVDLQNKEVPIHRENDFEDEYVEISKIPMLTSQEFNNVICERPKEEAIGQVGHTAFKVTPIASVMREDGFESKRVPAALSPYDPRLEFGRDIHPLKSSLDKYFKGEILPFDTKKLEYIENTLTPWLQNSLDKREFRKLEFEEIITGTREDGSNPMALNTSPGLPFVKQPRVKKGKRDFFEINENGEVENVSEEIRLEYLDFKEKMMKGILPLTVSYDFPKDELRPIKKALGSIDEDTPPKTRSVTCMNMFYIMLWRELTLDMWATFHRRADGRFPLCPGINPEGPEWSNAYHYLNKFTNVVDFDVSNWDGFVRPELMFLVGRIISKICGYELNSPEEIAIRAILTEVMFGYIQHGRIIYQKYRGIISGFPGTAEVNSLLHLILSLYIFLDIAEPYNMNYFQAWLDHVHQLIYGDDIIISISDEIFDWYNGISISDKYKFIGYPITSAVKDAPITKGRKLLECSFLKSTWSALRPTIWIRKMDIEVAYDLIYWVRAKEQPVDQFYSNLLDSLRIVFGHGKVVYDKFLAQVNNWLVKSKLDPVFIYYEDLLHDHISIYYDD